LKSILQKITILSNWLAVIALLLAYLAVYIPPDKLWFLAFFGLAYPYLLFLNLIFVFIWIYLKKRYFWISLLFIGIGYFHLPNILQFKGQKTNSPETIKVISFNCHHFISAIKEGEKNEPFQNIIDYLGEQQADILCIQESRLWGVGELSEGNLKKTLSKGKKLHLIKPNTTNSYTIFTRYDVKNWGEIHFEKSTNMVLWADLKTEMGMIRVYNCHFQSNRIMPDKYQIIKNPKLNIENQTVREVKELGCKLRVGYQKRANQVRQVKEHMDASPYPVIICADFNDTPVSYTYWQMSKNLKDTFVESGYGISNTYRGKLPALRIDYILTDNRFDAYNYHRHRVKYSDHYPISCELILQQSGSE